MGAGKYLGWAWCPLGRAVLRWSPWCLGAEKRHRPGVAGAFGIMYDIVQTRFFGDLSAMAFRRLETPDAFPPFRPCSLALLTPRLLKGTRFSLLAIISPFYLGVFR